MKIKSKDHFWKIVLNMFILVGITAILLSCFVFKTIASMAIPVGIVFTVLPIFGHILRIDLRENAPML